MNYVFSDVTQSQKRPRPILGYSYRAEPFSQAQRLVDGPEGVTMERVVQTVRQRVMLANGIDSH